MRIPFDKIYRAFPELDQFTDEQCEGYVREAREQHQNVVGGWGGAGLLVLVGGMLVVTAIGSGIERPVAQWLGRENDRLVGPVIGIVLLLGGLTVGVSSMTLRDIGLRKAIAKRLEGARCPQCMYSLLGLAVRAGDVMCPECGHVEHLADRGLSAADILGLEEKA